MLPSGPVRRGTTAPWLPGTLMGRYATYRETPVTLAAPRDVYRMGFSHRWKRVGLGLDDAILNLCVRCYGTDVD
jgi:hypothetical protein